MKAYLSIQAKSSLLSQSFIKPALAIYLLGLQHFFLVLNNNIEEKQHLQAGKGYLLLGLCSLFKERVLLLDKICEILSLMSIFSCLSTLLLPILPLADCVMSRWSANAVFAGLCCSWPLISMDLFRVFLKGIQLILLLWTYAVRIFIWNLVSLVAQVFNIFLIFNSPSFLTSETVIWQGKIDCFVYKFLHFLYFWHIAECHVLWFLLFPVCFCLAE